MLRRSFLLSFSASCLAGCAGAGAGHAFFGTGGFTCASVLPRGTRVYPERLRDFEDLVDDGDIEEQETPDLCWAAAIQAIFAYHGRHITQRDVLDRVKGASSGSATGRVREIIRGLSNRSSSWYLNNGDGRALVADLKAGNPVLMGLRPRGSEIGHVIVVYGVTYTMNQMTGQVFLDQVDIWDPAVGEGIDRVSACDIEEELVFALHSWRPG